MLQIGKEGKDTENFLPLIKDYKVDDFIKVVGFVDSAFTLISQFDIYLMTSKREGFPITIYESFMKKTVVVSTKAGGIPEAVVSNTSGLLAEIRDYKGLANHIYTLATHKEMREQFLEEAYSLVLNKFTKEQLAMSTLSAYNEVINDGSI